MYKRGWSLVFPLLLLCSLLQLLPLQVYALKTQTHSLVLFLYMGRHWSPSSPRDVDRFREGSSSRAIMRASSHVSVSLSTLKTWPRLHSKILHVPNWLISDFIRVIQPSSMQAGQIFPNRICCTRPYNLITSFMLRGGGITSLKVLPTSDPKVNTGLIVESL